MHSLEIKHRAIVHYKYFTRSLRKVSKIYGISKSSLQRWIRDSPLEGLSKKKKPKQTKEIKREIAQAVSEFIKNNPCCTIRSICDAISQTCKIKKSISSTGRIVKSLGFTSKRTYRTVSSTPSDETVISFCKDYSKLGEDTICIDEAGFYVGDCSRRGYSKRGQRIHIPLSKTLRREKITLILAVSSRGVVHYEILDHNCKKDDFIRFLHAMNAPMGSTLIMDNVQFHHSKETIRSIQDKNWRVLFVPPYSPRFNAIEYVFSMLKREYRQNCPKHHDSSHPLEYFDLLTGCIQSSGNFRNIFQRVFNDVEQVLIQGPCAFLGYNK